MLVQTYGSALIRYAAGMVSSVDIAQDVVQDVFLSLWQGRSRIENSWDIAAYLYGSTRQRALKFVRSAQARTQREDRWAVQRHVETDMSATIDVSANEADDVRMQVWNALAGVSPRCREVFMLVWDDELPYIEIARRMGLAEPTVRSYVSRALKQLIDVLRPRYRS
jgi:RNA polymerase sigma-70 factor (ECF subfamily)